MEMIHLNMYFTSHNQFLQDEPLLDFKFHAK